MASSLLPIYRSKVEGDLNCLGENPNVDRKSLPSFPSSCFIDLEENHNAVYEIGSNDSPSLYFNSIPFFDRTAYLRQFADLIATSLRDDSGSMPVISDEIQDVHGIQNKKFQGQEHIYHDLDRTVSWAEANQLLSAQFDLPSSMVKHIWLLADFDGDYQLNRQEYCIAAHLARLHSLGVNLPKTRSKLHAFFTSKIVRKNGCSIKQHNYQKFPSYSVNILSSSSSSFRIESSSPFLPRSTSLEIPGIKSSLFTLPKTRLSFNGSGKMHGRNELKVNYFPDEERSAFLRIQTKTCNKNLPNNSGIDDRMTRSASSAMSCFRHMEASLDSTDDPMIPFVHDLSDDGDNDSQFEETNQLDQSSQFVTFQNKTHFGKANQDSHCDSLGFASTFLRSRPLPEKKESPYRLSASSKENAKGNWPSLHLPYISTKPEDDMSSLAKCSIKNDHPQLLPRSSSFTDIQYYKHPYEKIDSLKLYSSSTSYLNDICRDILPIEEKTRSPYQLKSCKSPHFSPNHHRYYHNKSRHPHVRLIDGFSDEQINCESHPLETSHDFSSEIETSSTSDQTLSSSRSTSTLSSTDYSESVDSNDVESSLHRKNVTIRRESTEKKKSTFEHSRFLDEDLSLISDVSQSEQTKLDLSNDVKVSQGRQPIHKREFDIVELLASQSGYLKPQIGKLTCNQRRQLLVALFRKSKLKNHALVRLNNELLNEIQELSDQRVNLRQQLCHLGISDSPPSLLALLEDSRTNLSMP